MAGVKLCKPLHPMQICLNCLKSQGLAVEGQLRCPLDRELCADHMEQGYCPGGKYPFAALGSVIAWVLWKIGFTRWWLARNRRCRCGPRAAWLNRKTAPLFNWSRWLWGKLLRRT